MNAKLAVAAVTMFLSAGASVAQQPNDAPSPAPNTPAPTEPESTPPARQAAPPSDENRQRSDWRRGRVDRSGAARFYVQNGDVRIRIKCADDEPTKACADLLLQVLDRLEGSSSSGGNRDHYRDRDRNRDRESDE